MTIREYFTGRKKRYISLLVVIVLLTGMLPLTAFAHIDKLENAQFDYICGADIDSTIPPEIPDEIDDTDFKDTAPPLGQMPQTAVSDSFRVWILVLILSLLGLGALCFAVDFTTKKSRKKD